MLDKAPRFDTAAAEAIARTLFGREASASPLDSERDQNFLLRERSGDCCVLKIANAAESLPFLEAQQLAMVHAASRGVRCPTPLPALDGSTICRTTAADGVTHAVRLLTWLPGIPLGRLRHHARPLLRQLGRRFGELSAALADFDHPGLHREFHWDIERASDVIAAHLPKVADAGLRALVERIAGESGPLVAHAASRLPRAVIHNDANDHNIIVERPAPGAERFAGFIDFGDMIHGLRVADPAIAAAYAMLSARDPLAAACDVVHGYNKRQRLTEDELDVLFDVALLRLCQSVAIAAAQTAARPDPYLSISQGPIASVLPRLAQIPRPFAIAALRHACDLEPVVSAAAIRSWLSTAAAAPIVKGQEGPLAVLDLSVEGTLVSGKAVANVEPLLSRRVARVIEERGALAGIGRYGEPRLVQPNAGPIHLGIDFFVPAGTEVHAPFPGVVLTADAVADEGGPRVVLEHEVERGRRFYTMYSRLSPESVSALAPGGEVAAGEPFAAVGGPDVNGGWPTHLHVQVACDLVGLAAGYPETCPSKGRELWQALSPSPNLFLKIDGADYAARRLDPHRALASRWTRLGPSVRIAYKEPIVAARGWMQHLYDRAGRQYLDAYNNVPHVGHSHPRVTRAVTEQLQRLNTNTRYLYESLERYASQLLSTFPAPLRICYFVNSGTEANELALRLARAYTRHQDVLVLDGAYHGHSTTMIDVSPYKFNGPGGQGARPWVHVATLPDVYRGPYRRSDAADRYAYDVGVLLGNLGPGRLAAFLAETCPSVAGQILLPDGYLEQVYGQVRAAGGVCIADEVQTAYGRMGDHFYAFEAHGVVPDIVVLGKPIGNGYPIGAVVTTAEIAAAFDNGMEFFSTFGGSSVACAAGLAVLDVVHEEQLQRHAVFTGARLGAGLRQLSERHSLIGDVRGRGLFWGVELVKDKTTREAAVVDAAYVVNRLREEGVLIGTDGLLHNVLKIRPPMPFSSADATRLVETLDRVLAEVNV